METGKITLTMDFKRAYSLMSALEFTARMGMGQFKEIVDFMGLDIDWEKGIEIEKYLKEKLRPELSINSYDGISSKKVPLNAQIAWEAYQHIRREIAWNRIGKDWRKDKRDWNNMMSVSFDDPMKIDGLPGDFETSIKKE
jgi:hypothetical protein